MRHNLMDNLDWEAESYKTKDGTDYVRDFLDSLPSKDADKINRDIGLLEEHGPRWGHPHITYFKSANIYELRVKRGSNIFRIFFFNWKETILILTHGFAKKKKSEDT